MEKLIKRIHELINSDPETVCDARKIIKVITKFRNSIILKNDHVFKIKVFKILNEKIDELIDFIKSTTNQPKETPGHILDAMSYMILFKYKR